MKARLVNHKYIVIEIANLSLKYKRTDPRVKINHTVVFWRSPLLDVSIPVPIKQ
jgi:hypothetical protein